METSGGGQHGAAGGTAFASQGRDDFVQELVDNFEHQIGVEREVVGYILSGLAPEEQWQAGLAAGEFDLDMVARLIVESLERAAEQAIERDRIVIDVPLAERAFHEVIELRYRCPFPFFFC
jgi:hypothetical protein